MKILVFALAFISAGSLFSMRKAQSFYDEGFWEDGLEIFIEPSASARLNKKIEIVDNQYITIINKSGSPIVVYDEINIDDPIGNGRYKTHFWAYNIPDNKGLKFQPNWEDSALLERKIDRRERASIRLVISGSIQKEDVIIHIGEGAIKFGERICCLYNTKTDMIDITHNKITLKSLKTKNTDTDIHLGLADM